MTPNEQPPQPHATAKLYHPLGGQPVFMPLAANIDYAVMFAAYERALAAGWLVDAAGVEPGEEKEEVGFACRAMHEHDGEETPVIDLYSPADNMVWRMIRVYLNNAVEIAAFEQATGLVLASMPVNVGGATIERGKSKQTDALIVRCPRQPCHVILKPNPKHDPNETDVRKKKPKRLFVRWDGLNAKAAPANGQPQTEVATADADAHAMLERWQKWIAGNPPLDSFNRELRGIADMPTTLKPAFKAAAMKYAAARKWVWNKEKEGYVPALQEAI